jgi:hypothetical protein
VTTYHLYGAESREDPGAQEALQACSGKPLTLHARYYQDGTIYYFAAFSIFLLFLSFLVIHSFYQQNEQARTKVREEIFWGLP